MARVSRAGGQVMLQDLDGQLVWHDPVDEELQPMIDAVMQYLGTTGFDPFVGRKLFRYAKAAGLTDIQVQAEPYHFYAGRIDDRNLEHWRMKLDIALPVIERALGDRTRARQLKDRFLEFLVSDETLTYSMLFTVTGSKM